MPGRNSVGIHVSVSQAERNLLHSYTQTFYIRLKELRPHDKREGSCHPFNKTSLIFLLVPVRSGKMSVHNNIEVKERAIQPRGAIRLSK